MVERLSRQSVQRVQQLSFPHVSRAAQARKLALLQKYAAVGGFKGNMLETMLEMRSTKASPHLSRLQSSSQEQSSLRTLRLMLVLKLGMEEEWWQNHAVKPKEKVDMAEA